MNFVTFLIKVIEYPFKILCNLLIYLYKFTLSPLIPNRCIYTPSCSTYMLQSISEFGVVVGIYLGAKRIFRCTPFHKGGIDLVPYNILGDKKWIF